MPDMQELVTSVSALPGRLENRNCERQNLRHDALLSDVKMTGITIIGWKYS